MLLQIRICPVTHRLARLGGFATGALLFPALAWPSTRPPEGWLDLTGDTIGLIALAIFALAYLLVMLEEVTRLRKSKPVILAAGLIWALIGWRYAGSAAAGLPAEAFSHALLEFTELFLFLLVAMTYINTLEERQVFEALRSWLVRKRWTYRGLFWITGSLAFFLSPLIDNLTTSLVMCAVVLAVGRGHGHFITLSCVNIVVAANAGGAFSPFGDITTLMVWQQGKVEFQAFVLLFVPSLVNFLVPALGMHFFLPAGMPDSDGHRVHMQRGAKTVILLFAITVVTAVSFHHFLDLPPMLGMMTGLAYLQFFGYYLRRTHPDESTRNRTGVIGDVFPPGSKRTFDIYSRLARAEWDTLLFFYGVVLCVGGLGFIGYLELVSSALYGQLGYTWTNVLIGVMSAVIDNIPVMYAVLTMDPAMPLGQWLLVTLTAGVGGSLLSVGSAAGVALMGQARGHYTFLTHLRWSPLIALGYAASITVHLWLNAASF
jgi:NhaD family Na+/H+ antiporter